MNLKLETEFSKAPILQEVDELKRQIDELRPLSPEIEGRVMQKLKLEWNYNSNAIEGNKLSYGETTALLMHGITAKGKPLKDHMDIQGHNKAVEYLDLMIKDKRDFVEADIRGLHEVILGESYDSPAQTADGQPTTKRIEVGKYKSTANHVQTITGAIHYYATAEETPAKMTDLMNWYVETAQANIHPAVVAALFHHRFVAIHPFDDGNGRMARILMNLILMKSGYPPVVVKQDDKQNYYSLLSQADSGEDLPFIEYIMERLKSSLELYLKAINGGDIDEDEDIDKKIALLKMELESKIKPKKKASIIEINNAIDRVIIPFIKRLSKKTTVLFGEYFEYSSITLGAPLNEIGQDLASIDRKIDVIDEIRSLTRSSKKVDSFYFYIQFLKFRNPENTFNISAEFEIGFEDQEYSITDIHEINVYKFYNENLSIKEQDDIILKVINSLNYWITENTKE